MKIQVFGPGCAKCNKLYENVQTAVQELGLACEVEKVTDLQALLALNVLTTPALVIDGQVKLAGRVPSPTELKQLFR